MAEVYVDPEKLRNFARQLKQFGDFVDLSIDALNVALDRLGGSWRDQQYREFLQLVKETQQRLRNFVQEVDKVVPQLNKDAEAMEEYRRLKPPA